MWACLRSGVTLTSCTVTSLAVNVMSRRMHSVSSRLMSSLTLSRRFFTVVDWWRFETWERSRRSTPGIRFPTDADSERLRDLLENVALDDVARFVFVEVAELD